MTALTIVSIVCPLCVTLRILKLKFNRIRKSFVSDKQLSWMYSSRLNILIFLIHQFRGLILNGATNEV